MFKENEHPRDDFGRFTNKENSTKEHRQNTPYEELTKAEKDGKIELSRSEWAQWYVKLGEIERGGYVDKMSNGDKLIKVDKKLIISSGTYEKPKVLKVLSFETEELLFQFLKWRKL